MDFLLSWNVIETLSENWIPDKEISWIYFMYYLKLLLKCKISEIAENMSFTGSTLCGLVTIYGYIDMDQHWLS